MMRVAKYLSFVILFFMVLFLLQGNMSRAHDPYKRMAQFYREPENSLDVVFMGASHVTQGVNPLIVWTETGVPSFVLAQPAQPIYTTWRYLNELLRTQTPKVIFLETRYLGIFNGTMKRHDDESFYSIGAMRFTPNKLAAVSDASLTEYNIVNILFPIVNKHTIWKKWIRDGMKRVEGIDTDLPIEEDTALTKGYRSFFERYEFEPDGIVSATKEMRVTESGQIKGKNYTAISHIIALCKQKGIQLVFFRVPYPQATMKEEADRLEPFIQQLADENRIEYLNYAINPDELGIDWQTDLTDAEHMNENGARKVSEAIVAHLQSNMEKYNLINKKDMPEYKKWNTDADTYFTLASKRTLELAED